MRLGEAEPWLGTGLGPQLRTLVLRAAGNYSGFCVFPGMSVKGVGECHMIRLCFEKNHSGLIGGTGLEEEPERT